MKTDASLVPAVSSEDPGDLFVAPATEFDSSAHLLHGILHLNGFGHLLRVNGFEGGSTAFSGVPLSHDYSPYSSPSHRQPVIRRTKVQLTDGIKVANVCASKIQHHVTTVRPQEQPPNMTAVQGGSSWRFGTSCASYCMPGKSASRMSLARCRLSFNPVNTYSAFASRYMLQSNSPATSCVLQPVCKA